MNGGILRKVLLTAVICLVLWVAFKFVFPFALPFILAWAVAACLQPAVRLMAKRFGVGRKPVACVFVTVTVLGVGAVAFLLVSRFVSELGGVLSVLTENANGGISGIFDEVNGLLQRLPFASALGENISVAVAKAESYYGSKTGWMLVRPFCVAIFFGYPSDSRFFFVK